MSLMDNIINKYKIGKPNNNAFLGLSGGYNPNEISKEIDDFNTEYEKQQLTSEKFGNSEELYEKCKLFSKEYTDKIEKQAEELALLAKNLPTIVKINKENAEINEDMNELINSDHYVNLTNKLRSIKTNISKIKNFLVKEGIHDF
jgi:hypothetical protein